MIKKHETLSIFPICTLLMAKFFVFTHQKKALASLHEASGVIVSFSMLSIEFV